jgi:hypothetical protein
MGDYFQSIVDKDATETEAPSLGTLIRNWLVDEGIISSKATDCVLGSDSGYPPGPDYQKAIYEHDKQFLELWTNGLEIITKRHVFHSGQGGFDLVCPACSTKVELNEAWSKAVNEWYKEDGKGWLACSQCGNLEVVNEWKHDPDWGFGNLGFTFWNWPPLTDEFVKKFGKRLGHRIVLVSGKL